MRRPTKQLHNNHEFFDELPDEIVILILLKLSSTASSPSHFFSILLTCKKFYMLGLSPMVLSKAAPTVLAVKPQHWCETAHCFLRRCVDAGNTEACYTLGMIRFYCLGNRKSGLSLIAKAAMEKHAPALYSLSVIQFNGSGGSRENRDLTAGVAFSARASKLGHIDALRELGHSLQDGYGVKKNVEKGRQLLMEAKVRESLLVFRSLLSASPSHATAMLLSNLCKMKEEILRNNGKNVAVPEVHPVNWFLRKWFDSGRGILEDGLRLCAHIGCGRVETRLYEFRICSNCRKANYCSRGCQSVDWKLRHKMECLRERLL